MARSKAKVTGSSPFANGRTVLLLLLFLALLAGEAGQLLLTDPMWLQRLRVTGPEISAASNRTAVGLILAQAVVVALFVRRRRPVFAGALPWLAGVWRLCVALVVFLFCAVHASYFVPSRFVPTFLALDYGLQLLATAVLFVVNLGNVLLIGAELSAPVARLISRLLAMPGEPGTAEPGSQRGDRAIPWLCAGFAFAASAVLSIVALDRLPHIPDEVAYLFHARCLAMGRLAMDVPPVPKAFSAYLLFCDGSRWFASPPPGWPAVLALGCLAGVPWLVNPLLGGLAVLLSHDVTRRLSDRRTAHLVAAFLATSPWFLFLSASFMTHALSLVLVLLGWDLVLRVRDSWRGGSMLGGLLAGASFGYLTLVRPLEGLVAGALTGLWCLGAFGRRLPWSAIASFCVGCAAVASVQLAYNAVLSGNPFVFPINDYTDRIWYPGANRLGFGPDVGNPPGGWGILDPFAGHGWRDVLINTNQNGYCLNFELFGWGVGSLLLPLVHLLRGAPSRTDRFMLLWLGGVYATYSLYWFSGGPDFGARYWYIMIFPLVWLSARGVQTIAAVMVNRGAAAGASARITVAVGALVLAALLVFIPWRCIYRYQDYRGIHGDFRRLAAERHFGRSLVLVSVRGNRVKGPDGTPETWSPDWASALTLNDPSLKGDSPVFALDLGETSNRQLVSLLTLREVLGRDFDHGW